MGLDQLPFFGISLISTELLLISGNSKFQLEWGNKFGK